MPALSLVDLILPRTDRGVLIQLLAVVVLLGVLLWRFWSKPELRLLLIGVGLVLLGLMGLRALH